MHYQRICNSFYNSNTYIIKGANNSVIIIDPGSVDNLQLFKSLRENRWNIHSVILTHEHADHCAGVNGLYEKFHFQLLCSKACAQNISSNKQNLSLYIEHIPPFEIKLPISQIVDGETISFDGIDLIFIQTPGHSPGSICIFLDNAVFTGDTLLNKTKVPLNLPQSNRNQYVSSIEKLKQHLKPGMTIYPGHGESFMFRSFNQLTL